MVFLNLTFIVFDPIKSYGSTMFGLAFLLGVGAACAQIVLDGAKCGQLICKLEEYCSPDTNRCSPCSLVCNKTHHNYDSGICNKECLGYLFDLRYMRRSDNGAADLSDLNGVRRQAQAAIIVSAVALSALILVIIVVCCTSFSWRDFKQKFRPAKNRVKEYPTELTHHNRHAEAPKPKHELKLVIKKPDVIKRGEQPLNARDLETMTSQTEKSQGTTTPKTISTALSNRHPAEDATLDFSYDNMGMNVTPPEQPASSHKF